MQLLVQNLNIILKYIIFFDLNTVFEMFFDKSITLTFVDCIFQKIFKYFFEMRS